MYVSSYWRYFLFPIVYSWLLYHILTDHICMGLHIGSLFCCIDLWTCSKMKWKLFSLSDPYSNSGYFVKLKTYWTAIIERPRWKSLFFIDMQIKEKKINKVQEQKLEVWDPNKKHMLNAWGKIFIFLLKLAKRLSQKWNNLSHPRCSVSILNPHSSQSFLQIKECILTGNVLLLCWKTVTI